MKKPISNLAHSVHARLLKIADESGQNFNELLVRFFLERLLYGFPFRATAKSSCSRGPCSSSCGRASCTAGRATWICWGWGIHPWRR